MERYSIYEGHMEDLKKKITRIQNKCRKFGCDFHFAEVGEEFKDVNCPDGSVTKFKFIIVEAEGTAKINDWEFVAEIEHTEAGNIFRKAMTNVEIPARYRTTKCICEHCNSDRARKNTFIIRNSNTGDFRQVGKSCLMDYTHGMSAEFATYIASIHEIFEESQTAPVSFHSYSTAFMDTKEVLLYGAETIRRFGYSKSDSYDSTRDRMTRYFEVGTGRTRFLPSKVIEDIKKEMEEVGFNADSKEAHEMVEGAMQWIQEQGEPNDYMHNLKVATSLPQTNYSRFGILVSLFPTYNRELLKQAEKAEADAKWKAERRSQWIGQIGDRITIDVDSVVCVTSWSNCFDGYNTTLTFLYKIVDTEGNVFMWKTGKDLQDVKKIVGTVKEHSSFREVKQTFLTRCRVA